MLFIQLISFSKSNLLRSHIAQASPGPTRRLGAQLRAFLGVSKLHIFTCALKRGRSRSLDEAHLFSELCWQTIKAETTPAAHQSSGLIWHFRGRVGAAADWLTIWLVHLGWLRSRHRPICLRTPRPKSLMSADSVSLNTRHADSTPPGKEHRQVKLSESEPACMLAS